MQSKKDFRIASKQKIKSLELQKRDVFSKKIINKLKNYLHKYNSRGVYFPLQDEVNILPFIEILRNHDKKIIIPQIKDKELIPVIYGPYSETKIGKYGIKEIISPKIYTGEIDIFLIPGVAFSYKNQRIGRGLGYYDKFLSKYQNSYKIGVCFPIQIYEDLPTESYDILMDKLLF